jgi:hypothetical protein
MIAATRPCHSYDHRLHDLVRSTGNVERATVPEVPH